MRLSPFCKCSLVASLLMSSQFVFAASVTPFAGYRMGSSFDSEESSSVELSDESAFGVLFSWDYSPGKEGEFLLSHSKQDLQTRSGEQQILTETDVTYAHIGGRIWFGHDDAIQTSVAAGIGLSYFDSKDDAFDSETKASMHLGLGAKYQISENLALKSDARVFGSFFNSDHSIYCINGECLVRLRSEVYIQTELALGLEYKF